MPTTVIRKPKVIEAQSVSCPVCSRIHVADAQFGPFCCASCLQVVIRPLIVARTGILIQSPCPICKKLHSQTAHGPYCSQRCALLSARTSGQLGGMPDDSYA